MRKPRLIRSDEVEFRLRKHAAWLERLGSSSRRVRNSRPKLFTGPERIYRQRSVIKVSWVKNYEHGQFRKGLLEGYARYLERDGYEGKHKELGFDMTSERVDVAQVARDWTKSRDARHVRIILSPDAHERVNLVEHTRQVVGQMEQDLGTELRWVAVQHRNTDHQHVHIFMRGIRASEFDDRGRCRPLIMSRDYVSYGIREISERLVEQELGPRTEREYLESRGHGIEALRWTEIDRTINRKADLGVVDYSYADWLVAEGAKVRTRQEVERLAFLEGLGLATNLGDSRWELRPDWKDELREWQLDGDVIKSRARVHALAREQARMGREIS